MMDESHYLKLADDAFLRIENALKDVDADEVDFDRAGDVLTMTFRGGRRCVVNTQRPTRQIWVAASSRGIHFRYDEASSRWVDEKDASAELFASVERIVHEHVGLTLTV